MKLHVVSERKTPSPESLWPRFADIAFDHALAAGEDVTVGAARAVMNETPTALPGGTSVLSGEAPADAVADVLKAFDERHAARPRFILPDGGAFAGPFAEHRYRHRVWTLMRLRSATIRDRDADGLLILPGRAAQGPYAQWCTARADDDPAAALLPLHLDDPQYESFVALRGGAAVAAIGLQTRGQTGLIADLFVRPDDRLRGVATLLLGRALESAARGQLVDVFAAMPADDDAALRLFDRGGFVIARAFAEWLPPVRK